LRHHPCLFFQHRHDLHLVLRAHLHHAIGHVATHPHAAHIPTSAALSATPLVSTTATDAAIPLLSVNTVKSGITSAIHIAVELVQHSSTATLSLISVTHRLGSSGSVNKKRKGQHVIKSFGSKGELT
jgi:hypothetical protein